MALGSRLQELTAKYMQNPRRFFVPLANEYRLAGDLDRAIALCREHLPAQPGHMSGHIVLGRAYFEKGDYEAAHDVFLTSVSLDDENLIALRHLGDIARSRAEVVEARGWYARVLDADPENREIEQLLRSLDVPASAREPGATPSDTGAASEPFATPEALPSAPAVSHPDAFGDPTSALSDPTPPGLRAILGREVAPAFDADLVRVPDAARPAATRPLETFDLSTLGEAVEAEIAGDATGGSMTHTAALSTPAAEFGITVEGAGFAFGELDEFVDPSGEGSAPDALPPIEEADFSTGVETPTATAAQTPAADDLLSRPVFGALASFASWRTAQERETPGAVPAQPAASANHPTPESAAAYEDTELFGQDPAGDASETAPEFVTETMAALYAQQGFTRQALDIYRTLLERSPGDAGLTMKVLQLQAELDTPVVDDVLEADADKALQFGDLRHPDARQSEAGGILEEMYEVSPPASSDALDDAFGSAWTPASDADVGGGDDWFADTVDGDPIGEFRHAEADIFGLSTDGLTAGLDDAAMSASAANASRSVVSLASLLGGAAVAAADETAADMLSALAGQMVGRLPKEPPTLPVPEVLELPSGAASDESTGASPAPLLSFDRFFSGSGSPPRPRIDTPVRSVSLTSRDIPPVAPSASPSLSPTFGGVPVIPPPKATPASTWAGFDQFVPPAQSQPPAPTPGPAPTPTGAFWTPPVVPAVPASPPVPSPATPVASSAQPAEPAPPAAEPAAEQPRRTPPSEFHRWLEGLS